MRSYHPTERLDDSTSTAGLRKPRAVEVVLAHLGDDGKPELCAYFEQSLLPAAPGSVVGDYATRVGRTATEKGAALIRAWLGGVERLCECGAPLPPRRRKCDACCRAAKRLPLRPTAPQVPNHRRNNPQQERA